MRRWLDENFSYKFDYHSFGIATIVNEKARLHVKLDTKRQINEHEQFISAITLCYFDEVRCVVLGYEVKLDNIGIDLSDPQFFEKLKQTLTEYLTAFEKAGYVFPRK